MDNNLVQIALQNINMAAILPSVILSCFGMGLLLINVFLPRGTTRHAVWISLIGLVVTGFFVMTGWGDPQYGFNDAVAMDNFAAFFSITFLFAAGLTILMSDDYLTREGYPVSEYYPMVLFATAGAMWMASGTDMMTIFLGLEVMSICLYVLAGFFCSQVRSNEAGLKYFLLGAFSSGFFVYGMALLYGATGSLDMMRIGSIAASEPTTLLWIGLGLVVIGLAFKIAVVPFHQWVPDVYQGAITPVTLFIGTAAKIASLARSDQQATVYRPSGRHSLLFKASPGIRATPIEQYNALPGFILWRLVLCGRIITGHQCCRSKNQ